MIYVVQSLSPRTWDGLVSDMIRGVGRSWYPGGFRATPEVGKIDGVFMFPNIAKLNLP